MKAKTGVEVLKAMEWLLTNIGWCQHFSYRDKSGACMYIPTTNAQYKELGSMCLLGAMAVVDTEPRHAWAAVNLILDVNEPDFHLAHFNDTPGRTKEQVIKLLHKAIKKGSKQ